MGLAVKIDEDLPARVSDLLRSAGHQAETVVGQGMGGAKDATLWEAVQVERRSCSLRLTRVLGIFDSIHPGRMVGCCFCDRMKTELTRLWIS
jgi:hypothetical protein